MNFSGTIELGRSGARAGAARVGVLFALAATACGGQATDVEQQSSIDLAPVAYEETLPPQSLVDDDGKQCPRAKFKTIQAALDAAKTGDTILVCAGKYRETPVVQKTVTLLGAQHGVDARTREPNPDTETLVITDGFDVEADSVVFDGFSLQALFMGEPDDTAYGLFLHEDHSGYRVVNNIMGGTAAALFLGSSGAIQTEVMHNHFSGRGVFADNDEPTVHARNERIEENAFDGALLGFGGPGHSDLRILNNELRNGAALTLFDNYFPTGMPDIRGVTVQGNTIENPGTRPAVSLRHVRDSEFLNNTLEGGGSSGFAIVGANSDVYVGGNLISNFGGSGIQVGEAPVDGLDQELTTGVMAEANKLNHDATGIELLSARGNSFSRNTVLHSFLVGIAVDVDSASNTFESNEVSSSKQLDCQDRSVDGGNSKPHDTWTHNQGKTSTPAELCVSH